MTEADMASLSTDEVVADAAAILQDHAPSSQKAESLVRRYIEAKNDWKLAIYGSRFSVIEEPPDSALERLVGIAYLLTQASAKERSKNQEAT